ncbi:DUF4350 domain-containing protein [Marisediminicola sp. LYQ134]|uniref:DUF4350 domain-containing protein n=1 Tax=Marisediminicola sp. LYQ134 TaxID=3391061 RepID=UPI0039834FAE
MTAPAPAPALAPASDSRATVLTPTLRQSGRRSLFWIVAFLGVVLLAVGSLLLVGASDDARRLSPANPAPEGTMAVAEVLRQQGVDVVETSSLDETRQALSGASAESVSIALFDPDGILDADQLAEVTALSERTVLIEPGFTMLRELAPGVSAAGAPDDDALETGCSRPAIAADATVSPGGVSYRVDDDAAATADVCLRSESEGSDPAYSFVSIDRDGSTLDILGATDALTNGQIRSLGNAAFALTVLGETDTLVWYLPSASDSSEIVNPADFTPPWVTPAITLAVALVVVAAVWRGRRFGPLIVENLPVTPRSSETMEGRARLYQKAAARSRALDALRIGSVARLARACGLASSATLDEVILAVASVLGTDPRSVRETLVDSTPETDVDLVRSSDDLLALEASVRRAVAP